MPLNATVDAEYWPPSENVFDSTAAIIGWCIFYVIIIVITLADNALVMTAFVKFAFLRSLTNYLVVSLACNDVMVAAFAMPSWIGYLIFPSELAQLPQFAVVFTSLDIFVSTASIINLACISIDRFICISCPYQYREIITRNRVISAIVMMRVWGVLLCTPSFVLKDQDYLLQHQLSLCILSYFIPLSVIIICYSAILRIAISHQKRIAMNVPNAGEERHRKLSFAKELKAAKTLAVVIGVFLVSWSPFFIMNFLIAIDSLKYLTFVYFHPEIIYYIKCMHYTNSCLNFFVYATMSRDFREAFRRMLFSRPLPDIASHYNAGLGITLHERTLRG